MIHFEINQQKYSAIETWNEMTLEKGISFSALCRTAPDKLLDFYSILSSGGPEEETEKHVEKWKEALAENDFVKEFPEFYGKVICELSNIPEDVMKYVTAGDRIAVYKKHFESFVLGILHEAIDYTPQHLTSFKFENVEYQLPITRNILGNERPMADRTTLEFTESADLQLASKEMSAGKFEFAANIVAILCRPMIPIDPKSLPTMTVENHLKVKELMNKKEILEPYNEVVCLERAEKFKQLTMDIVFEVFFCLAKHILLFNQRSVISSLQKLQVEQDELRSQVV